MDHLPLSERLELIVFFIMTLTMGIAFGWFSCERWARIRYHRREIKRLEAELAEINRRRGLN